MRRRRNARARRIFTAVVTAGVLAVILAGLLRFGPVLFGNGNANTVTSSELTKAIDIAELSTAEFKYRGIAEIYTDESRSQVRCRVCYNAVVKAGIDMKDVKLEVDPENKRVTAALPDLKLNVTVIDEQKMALLPSDADVSIGEMLKAAGEDALNEAQQSGELMAAARDNLAKTIEGLLLPVLEAQGFSLAWN
ncbi:MAG: DUF4230 domain-containing protein [Clostridia bacterium]|nr:DUF4230 domain-containing protein [Clostridia bacterium]